MAERPQMTGAEVQAAIRALDSDQSEVARELRVSPRTVRRWASEGCAGPPAVALRTLMRLVDVGLPWLAGAVPIDFNGPLTAAEAVARHAAIKHLITEPHRRLPLDG